MTTIPNVATSMLMATMIILRLVSSRKETMVVQRPLCNLANTMRCKIFTDPHSTFRVNYAVTVTHFIVDLITGLEIQILQFCLGCF